MIIGLDSLLASRKSIRKYAAAPVPDSYILQMIDSARQVASPSNAQPVRYVRLVSENSRNALSQSMDSGYRELLELGQSTVKPRKVTNVLNHYLRYSQFMFDAPALFAVGVTKLTGSFAERLNLCGITTGKELETMGSDISVGLSLQSFMLKAVELGLGTCVLTAPLYFMRDNYCIPGMENLQVKCFITAGYPDEQPVASLKKEIVDIYREV